MNTVDSAGREKENPNIHTWDPDSDMRCCVIRAVYFYCWGLSKITACVSELKDEGTGGKRQNIKPCVTLFTSKSSNALVWITALQIEPPSRFIKTPRLLFIYLQQILQLRVGLYSVTPPPPPGDGAAHWPDRPHLGGESWRESFERSWIRF